MESTSTEASTMYQTQSGTDVKLDYIQRDVREIKESLKDNVTRREFNEAIKDIREEITPYIKKLEETNALASGTLVNYKTDKARIWVAIAILVALGGTIITLSIFAINTKIKVGITEALSQYDIEVK